GCAANTGDAPGLQDLAARLCADNPAGQGRERTSIVLAFASSVAASATPDPGAREYEPVLS
ncbi:MAG: hypothetical protein L0Y54_05495, partial [Sporichthyaceae bacterium]|nr:hypothetical protein [Sporichthyaceae bacterium]